jgi:hypothetical protein
MPDLRRRQFITLLGGASVWPRYARSRASAFGALRGWGPGARTNPHPIWSSCARAWASWVGPKAAI